MLPFKHHQRPPFQLSTLSQSVVGGVIAELRYEKMEREAAAVLAAAEAAEFDAAVDYMRTAEGESS